MKSFLLYASLGVSTLILFSQCGQDKPVQGSQVQQPEQSVSLNIEPGTTLSYKVSPANLVNYNLDISFKELSPKVSFEFVMTNMDYTKGIVEIAENAVNSSYTYSNQYVDGKSVLADKTILILSTSVYRDLLEARKATINWNGTETVFNQAGNEDYLFEKGNMKVVEKTIHCISQDNTIEFWVWKNPKLPLIMKSKGGISSELAYWYLPGEKP